ncbi:MAG: molybdopterin-guanine dinucleotide biosynthesis protein B [Thermoanaerobaculum sp.]|nr:molybdopterin-guanine dinucleotide biosynthesis protein B [Thermoanaerobaculum sp.]MDW7967700.1 molybdopterin-guanine dinucleotide biosynthesis protein B [Thermoanaerobaculum sp.]
MAALPVPVLAFCGFSGSGKTTLLESLIPLLAQQGLVVGLIKHDAHGVVVDQPGKDSDRLFRAGAQLCLRAPNETFTRWHPSSSRDLPWALGLLAWQVDLILVEGHKDTPLPKVWLEHPQDPSVPETLQGLVEVLPWGSARLPRALELAQRLVTAHQPPLWGGILLGGHSSRMGTPKQLLSVGRESALARVARTLASQVAGLAYLGAGPLPADAPPAPQIPDPPGPGGPLAGMVAALRWQPTSRWLIVPVDAIALSPALICFFREHQRPGWWAVQLKNPAGELEPLFALLSPQIQAFADQCWQQGQGPRALAQHEKAHLLPVPEPLGGALASANTPEAWHELVQKLKP